MPSLNSRWFTDDHLREADKLHYDSPHYAPLVGFAPDYAQSTGITGEHGLTSNNFSTPAMEKLLGPRTTFAKECPATEQAGTHDALIARRCEHDLAERETACADGMCPICTAAALEAAQRELAELRDIDGRRADAANVARDALRMRAERAEAECALREEFERDVMLAEEGREWAMKNQKQAEESAAAYLSRAERAEVEAAALRELLRELREDGWIREDHSPEMTPRLDAALAQKEE